MHHDANVTTRRVTLRQDRFDTYTNVLGATSDPQRAKLLGLAHKTIRRARAGQVGARFQALTISSLRRHEEQLKRFGLKVGLDELFEVA